MVIGRPGEPWRSPRSNCSFHESPHLKRIPSPGERRDCCFMARATVHQGADAVVPALPSSQATALSTKYVVPATIEELCAASEGAMARESVAAPASIFES